MSDYFELITEEMKAAAVKAVEENPVGHLELIGIIEGVATEFANGATPQMILRRLSGTPSPSDELWTRLKNASNHLRKERDRLLRELDDLRGQPRVGESVADSSNKKFDYWLRDLELWSKLDPKFCLPTPRENLPFRVFTELAWSYPTSANVQAAVQFSIKERKDTFCDLTIDPLEAKAVIYNGKWYMQSKGLSSDLEGAYCGLCISPEPPAAMLHAYVAYLLDVLDMRGKI